MKKNTLRLIKDIDERKTQDVVSTALDQMLEEGLVTFDAQGSVKVTQKGEQFVREAATRAGLVDEDGNPLELVDDDETDAAEVLAQFQQQSDRLNEVKQLLKQQQKAAAMNVVMKTMKVGLRVSQDVVMAIAQEL